MKVVILAGGFGTRISEESHLKPKPMIEIGGMPILWHIMKTYSEYGFHEFVICAGYKQEYIKEWFSNYFFHTSDVTFDFTKGGEITVHRQHSEPWKVTVVDTGLHTMTGGRVKRIRDYIDESTFMLTYGDAVSDINIEQLLEYHAIGYYYCAEGILEYARKNSGGSDREHETWRAYAEMSSMTNYFFCGLPQEEKEKISFPLEIENELFEQIIARYQVDELRKEIKALKEENSQLEGSLGEWQREADGLQIQSEIGRVRLN